jgi:beta-glucosidase
MPAFEKFAPCWLRGLLPAAGLLLAAGPLLAAGLAQAADAGATRGVAHPELWPGSRHAGLEDPADEARLNALLQRMSLEEKVGQVILADIDAISTQDLRRYPLGAVMAGGDSLPGGHADRQARHWLARSRELHAVALQRRAGHTPIPLLFGIDAAHGNSEVRGATIFPHNVGLGAAHDTELIARIGDVTAQEIAIVGIDWAFAPSVAVPQDLRWGRSYEAFGQDPVLVAADAAAMVRGLQGSAGGAQGPRYGHVAATAKHFIADGGTTDGIDQGDAELGEQQLIDTHAPGFLSSIDAGVMSVMASYSSWQGRRMHGNSSLLSGVLKGRLGFEGFVVGDWNAQAQLPGCSTADCPAAYLAGIDMLMAPDDWKGLYEHTLAEVRAGTIPQVRLEDAVRRILRVKLKLGLFSSGRHWEGRFDQLGSAEHLALARRAVRESLVLLKNERHVLPIPASARVLVAGEGADDIGRQCGGWTLSWQGHSVSAVPVAEGATGAARASSAAPPFGQSIFDGLRAALQAGGGSASLDREGRYRRRPDVAVVVFGERPYAEWAGDLRSLDYAAMDPATLALLRRLKQQDIPVIAVLLSGRPLQLDPEIDAADAVVAAWLPGAEGGGVADVLVGTAAGAPRFDFRGTLSFAWPAAAASSEAAPAVRYALGYGLHYRGD